MGEVRSFLGLANYFLEFIQGYSKVVLPLTSLTQKGKVFEWTNACQEAFNMVKKLLTQAPG